MSEQDLTYKVTVEQVEEAIAQLRQLKAQVGQQGEAAETVTEATRDLTEQERKNTEGKRSLTQASQGVGESFTDVYHKALALYQVLTRAVSAIEAVTEEWQRQSNILGQFSGNVTEADRRINGLVAQIDLMKVHTELATAGVRLSGHDFANLTVAAKTLADATGTTTVDAFNRLREGLIKGSAEGFLPLGIALDTTLSKSDQMRSALAALEERFGTTSAQSHGFADSLTRIRAGLTNVSTAFVDTLEHSEQWRQFMHRLGDDSDGFFDRLSNGARVFALGTAQALNRVTEHFQDIYNTIASVVVLVNSGDFQGAAVAWAELNQRGRGRLETFVPDLMGQIADEAGRVAGAAAADQATTLRAPVGGARGGGTRQSAGPGFTTGPGGEFTIGGPEIGDLVQEARARQAAIMGGTEEEFRSTVATLVGEGSGLDEFQSRMDQVNQALKASLDQAALDFNQSWSDGIDGVLAAAERYDRAAQRMGEASLGLGRVVKVGLRGELKGLADFLSGTLHSALEASVAAWVDGSASMGQAVEQFVKTAINALVKHSVVKALEQTAEALASAAMLDVKGAALHGAAAVAWGALAAGAGAVGLATGAIGGGGGGAPGGGASQPSRFDESRTPGESGGGGTTNVYVGTFPVSTKREIGRTVEDVLAVNGRFGGRVLPRGGRRR